MVQKTLNSYCIQIHFGKYDFNLLKTVQLIDGDVRKDMRLVSIGRRRNAESSVRILQSELCGEHVYDTGSNRLILRGEWAQWILVFHYIHVCPAALTWRNQAVMCRANHAWTSMTPALCCSQFYYQSDSHDRKCRVARQHDVLLLLLNITEYTYCITHRVILKNYFEFIIHSEFDSSPLNKDSQRTFPKNFNATFLVSYKNHGKWLRAKYRASQRFRTWGKINE